MKSVLVAVLLAFASTVASAKDLVFTQGAWRFTLTQSKCDHQLVRQIARMVNLEQALQDGLMNGSLEGEGRVVKMCYVLNPINPGQMMVIDEEGDLGIVDFDPKQAGTGA